MPLRQRLENLPVGQKLLAALLVLLTTVLLVANLTFISAAYYISQESMAPQALQTIGRLVSNPSLVSEALQSPQNAERLLNELNSYSPLRAAALYDGKGERLAQLQHGEQLSLPTHYRHIESWPPVTGRQQRTANGVLHRDPDRQSRDSDLQCAVVAGDCPTNQTPDHPANSSARRAVPASDPGRELRPARLPR
jgi:hypothetical protein